MLFLSDCLTQGDIAVLIKAKLLITLQLGDNLDELREFLAPAISRAAAKSLTLDLPCSFK